MIKKKIRVFLDSDVIISSIISEKGAARILLREKEPTYYISTLSKQEIKKVIKRLKLDIKKFNSIVKKVKILDLKKNAVGKEHENFVKDKDDAHIAAGARLSKSKFLLTYNSKDFKIDKIKRDLNIIVLRPAQFLQYLRSIKKIN